jgi:hypothetical protein
VLGQTMSMILSLSATLCNAAAAGPPGLLRSHAAVPGSHAACRSASASRHRHRASADTPGRQGGPDVALAIVRPHIGLAMRIAIHHCRRLLLHAGRLLAGL